MTEFQREVLQQIKLGIDRARHEGVVVEYPRGALIDDVWVAWPFDAAESGAQRAEPNREAPRE